jgi:integrase
MGYVTRRGKSWQAAYRDPSGRERTKTFRRKVDAEHFLAEMRLDLTRGQWIDPRARRITFREYAEQWRAVQMHGHGTEVSVEQHLRLHVYPILGERPVGTVRPTEIQGLVRHLSSSLAPATVAVVYGRVVSIFRAATRDRIVGTSPCVEIRLPRSPTKAVTEVLEPDQVLTLAKFVPPRYRAVIIAGAGLGLRPGELFGLTSDRVEFLRRSVRIDQQMVRIRGEGVRLASLKTAASYRSVPLPEVVAKAIASHMQSWPAHREMNLVFTNERNAPIQQFPFSMVFEHARVKAGLPDWATPHDLRHFYASTLIRSGASIKVVQTRLGHSSAKTTLDVYGHLFRDEDDRTRQAVEDALSTADIPRTQMQDS